MSLMSPAAASSCQLSESLTEVDVVIVTWNTMSLTLQCLSALRTILRDEAIASTVWVVDNSSQDDTVARIRIEFPEVVLIENNYNGGFSVANNIAIKKSLAPFILLLNSDAFLRPNALSMMLKLLREDSKVSAVGPKLIMESGEVQNSVALITNPVGQAIYLAAFHFPPIDRLLRLLFQRHRDRLIRGNDARVVPLLSAACLLLRREIFNTVGLLPEDRFLYSEEDDLFFRMRHAGFISIYLPQAEAIHLGGASTGGTEGGTSEHFHRSRLRFLYRHFPKNTRFIYLIHCTFFGWCFNLIRLKRALRNSDKDNIYLAIYKLLLEINRQEFIRANHSPSTNE